VSGEVRERGNLEERYPKLPITRRDIFAEAGMTGDRLMTGDGHDPYD
jgi:hypothetical protein